MNTVIVARKINERRLRPNPVITTGEILSTIGSEGMQEALQRHWLVPDIESGFMMVNMNAGKLAEVVEACRCPECHNLDCACECLKTTDSNQRSTAMPRAMREAWSGPGVGSGSNGGPQGQMPLMPHSPPQPVAPTTPPPKPIRIGDQMAVKGPDNTLYPGTVSGEDNGMYNLDFGAGKQPPPTPGRRGFGPDQLQRVQPAANA